MIVKIFDRDGNQTGEIELDIQIGERRWKLSSGLLVSIAPVPSAERREQQRRFFALIIRGGWN